MAETDLQRRMDRLDEVSVVQAAIMDRLERKYDEAIRRHDQEMADLRGALKKLVSSGKKTNEAVEQLSGDIRALGSMVERTNAAVERLTGDVQIMNSAMIGLVQRMDGLNERIDRFIRGRESNGHGRGGKKK